MEAMGMRAIQMKVWEEYLGGAKRYANPKGGKGTNRGNDKFLLHNYAEFYDSVLPEDPQVIVEMGVLGGHSLYIWEKLFPNARVVGLDIAPENCVFPELEVHYFDQLNPDLDLLESFNCDVFIDDALHTMESQAEAFYALSPFVSDVYIVEDIPRGKSHHFLDRQEGRIGVKYL